MLRVPLVGNLKYAKSRTGSHISVNVGGKYSPTECPSVLVICNDFLLKIDDTLVFFFSFSNIASYPPSYSSRLSTESGGLVAPEPDDDEDGPLPLFTPSLNMWTVSCAELTANSVDIGLKFIEYITASLVPRLNWYSFSALGMFHTRMTVPFSEAVARRVPVELMERKDKGVLCAWMALTTVKERVEKMWTSPFWGGEVDGGVGAEDVAEREVDGEGTGEG